MIVCAASTSENRAGIQILDQAKHLHPTITKTWVDQGFKNQFVEHADGQRGVGHDSDSGASASQLSYGQLGKDVTTHVERGAAGDRRVFSAVASGSPLNVPCHQTGGVL